MNMDFKELVVSYKEDDPTIWVSMKPMHRQCFTITMLQELRELFNRLDYYGSPYRNVKGNIEYLVMKSEHPKIYNAGGDLNYFYDLIHAQDREKLTEYATACIDLIYWGLYGGKRNITTIASVAGDALGGGFETVLSCQYIIAEQQSTFAFPETLFGLFPGMGGYVLFSRYVGKNEADRAICTGKRYSAKELADKGVIYSLVNTNEAELEINNFIRSRSLNKPANQAILKMQSKILSNIYSQLKYNIELWIESAMSLTERDLAKIRTLVKRQERKSFGSTSVSSN